MLWLTVDPPKARSLCAAPHQRDPAEDAEAGQPAVPPLVVGTAVRTHPQLLPVLLHSFAAADAIKCKQTAAPPTVIDRE